MGSNGILFAQASIAALAAGLAGCPALAGGSVALPKGGAYVAGSGSIAASGKSLTIDQTSKRGIIDWKSFSIGKGGSVTFDNKSGATLNRVLGGDLSAILGTLKATGMVYLINPQGVVIGKSGVVVTGGSFTASTLDVANSAFLAGGTLLFKGRTDATVKNLGSISSTGGDVFLIARSVENDGAINAANGTVGLAAGNRVLIKDASADERVFVQVGGGDAINAGTIAAASAELKAAGGNVYALAGSNGGIIRATGTATRDGHVWLTASGGNVSVAGTVAAANADGTGGAITAKGATLKIADNTVIDAAGTKGHGTIETSGHKVSIRSARVSAGKDGSWLVDPNDLTIDATLAGTIDNALDAGTNVTEQTTASGTGGNGDIFVNSNIAWDSSASLTLTAYRNIAVAKGVTIANAYSTSGGAIPGLTLHADNTGTGAGTLSFGTGGKVDFSQSDGAVAIFYNPRDKASQTTVNATRYRSTIGYAGGSAGYAGQVALGTDGATLTATMLVNNLFDLQNMQNNLTANYALTHDIDASATASWNAGAGFDPIGNNFKNKARSQFSGTFDGQGHVISNLTIDNPALYAAGLFGAVNGSADPTRRAGIIRNIGLTGSTITGSSYVGGLVGHLIGGTVESAYNTGAISGTNSVGGLIGSVDLFGTVAGTYSNGSVSGHALVGGLIGALSGLDGESGITTVTVQQSYSTGAVTGSQYVGGFVGLASLFATISQSYSTGAVSGASFVGGFAGRQGSFVTLQQTYSTGAVSATTVFAGGLVGFSDGGLIAQSYNTGTVTGGSYTGGLVGQGYGNISQSYNTGAVSGTSYVGGLEGFLVGGQGHIDQSYSSGPVSGANHVGGLVGTNYAGISNSYWDVTTSGQTASGASYAVTGLTTAQMADQANYPGWDFTNIWYLVPGMAHPILRSELYGTTIVNAHQLELIGQNATTLAGHYTLGADISMAELGSAAGPWLTAGNASVDGGAYGFVPIGSLAKPFTGTLNGEGNTINGLTIQQPEGPYVGLFGDMAGHSAIGNVGLVGGDIEGSTYVGGLAGYVKSGSIANSYASGTVSGQYRYVGGLVGYNAHGVITGSHTAGSVSGFNTPGFVGGVAGYNTGTISRSYSTATVSGMNDVGGLAGGNAGTISQSYNTATVDGRTYVGGLVGYNTGAITGSYSSGSVVGGDAAGGDAYRAGGLDVGGLVGDNHGTISASDNSGSVTVTGYLGNAGGLVGTNEGAITGSYSTGTVFTVFGPTAVGGLVGSDTGAITQSYATGTVSAGQGQSPDVGGLVGYLGSGGTIKQSYSTGAVYAFEYVGGLVGTNDGAITQSFSTGAVFAGDGIVGGLVGNDAGAITQSFSTGAVSTPDGGSAGGLVGLLSAGGAVTQCYSTGEVPGQYAGGLIGANSGGTVTFSYWDTQASGQASSAGGTGLTTAQLQSGKLPAGFDPTVWGSKPGLYPYLLWLYPNGP